MNHDFPVLLPPLDRVFLRLMSGIVPSLEREEWSRSWESELWHMHHLNRTRDSSALARFAELSMGLALDAFWLRTEGWRLTLRGTALLCVSSLLCLNILAALFVLVLQGSLLTPLLAADLQHCLVAAPLVVFVSLATASRRHLERSSIKNFRAIRQLFFIAQLSQVLLLVFLSSAALCLPVQRQFPSVADLLQIFCFVLFALIGLRWALRDQEQRCKHCLHSLTTPERIGRPSHNLLEWNGTELNCTKGHGQLSVPEMETSWCQSSQWTDLNVAS